MCRTSIAHFGNEHAIFRAMFLTLCGNNETFFEKSNLVINIKSFGDVNVNNICDDFTMVVHSATIPPRIALLSPVPATD